MAWARAALERNDQLEIVAEDADARTFTVRAKDSDDLRVIRVDEIAATVAQAPETASPAASTAPAVEAPAEPAPTETAEPGELASTSAPGAEEEPREERPEAPREPVAAVGTGRVIASGPGYSIQAGEPSPRATAERTSETTAAVERRTEPLVCQGSRFLRIDGRNISFQSDALVVEEGCELYITNSRITASGVGIAVRGSNVHIRNSTVAGDAGAIDASGNAQIYAHSSQFRGMVRRQDDAVVHDMGGNVWN
jgi:hypothetical protein